jgi:hypothetical protein
MRALIGIALGLLLVGCGSAQTLKPQPGQALPPAPYGATATPDAGALMNPTTQQRPRTVDELLKNSEERRSDQFDLPPED